MTRSLKDELVNNGLVTKEDVQRVEEELKFKSSKPKKAQEATVEKERSLESDILVALLDAYLWKTPEDVPEVVLQGIQNIQLTARFLLSDPNAKPVKYLKEAIKDMIKPEKLPMFENIEQIALKISHHSKNESFSKIKPLILANLDTLYTGDIHFLQTFTALHFTDNLLKPLRGKYFKALKKNQKVDRRGFVDKAAAIYQSVSFSFAELIIMDESIMDKVTKNSIEYLQKVFQKEIDKEQPKLRF